MTARRHASALAALLALSLALTGCSGDEGAAPAPSATPSATPSSTPAAVTPTESPEPSPTAPAEEPADYTRIPNRTRTAYFTSSTARTARDAFTCTSGSASLTEVPNIRDFDSTAFVDGDFAVVREAVILQDPSAAEAALDVVYGSLPLCTAVTGTFKSDFSASTARFFGVRGGQSVLSQTRQDVRAGGTFFVIDVVTTDGNAVVWTRIGSDIPVKDSAGVMAKLPANDAWFDEVRTQGDLGLDVLASLRTARR